MADAFRKFAERAAKAVGSPWAFLLALLAVVVWAATGPIFGYSDTWQLLINTSTTIITFLMVFIIQNTQNREAHIVTLKLDELLRSVQGARTELVGLDHMSDEELAAIEQEFSRLQHKASILLDDDIAHIRGELGKRRGGR